MVKPIFHKIYFYMAALLIDIIQPQGTQSFIRQSL